jgi:hypothetical protein
MEHPWSIFFNAVAAEYTKLFADAALVWCFAPSHRQHMLQSLHFPAERVLVVPIYTATPTYPDVRSESFLQRAAAEGWNIEAVDMAFSGSHSPYRERVTTDLYQRAVRDGLTALVACNKWTQLPFGEERHVGLVAAKVVLNVHRDEGSCLEVHRVNHLLSLGKCVVSERSTADPEVDAAYEGAVVFADNTTHLYALARRYALDDSARLAVEQAARAKFEAIEQDTAALAQSMEHVHHALRASRS